MFGWRDGWRTTWQVKRDKNRERFVHSKSLDRRVMSLLRSPPFPFHPRILPIRFSISPYSRSSLGAATPFQDWPRDSRLPRFCFELWLTDILDPGGYTKPMLCTYIGIHTRMVFHKYVSADTRDIPDVTKFACERFS